MTEQSQATEGQQSDRGQTVAAAKISQSKPGHGPTQTRETGRHRRLDPTRYGDWEKNGRCIDF